MDKGIARLKRRKEKYSKRKKRGERKLMDYGFGY